MKKQAFYILTALTFITMAGISQAYGQVSYASKYDIPFDFSIRGHKFPAGTYIVERSPLPHFALLIRSTDGNSSSMFPVIPMELRRAPNQSQLVFSRYGDRYLLRNVRTAGLDIGSEVLKTKSELRLERELAARGPAPEQVVLVASNRLP
jgi:hypothetical protein